MKEAAGLSGSTVMGEFLCPITGNNMASYK
jgi:hypothetical protein